MIGVCLYFMALWACILCIIPIVANRKAARWFRVQIVLAVLAEVGAVITIVKSF